MYVRPTAIILLLLFAQPASAAAVRIVAFGDSATSGWLVPHDQAYPAQLQKRLRAKGHDVTVKNAGIAGDTAAGALKRFDMAIDPGTAICIVEFGTNDLGNGASMKTVRARLTELIRTLRARHIEVLVVGLGKLDFADVALANDALYVQWKLPRGKYRASDGAHYNAEGYAILVGQMLPQVEELIRRVSGAPKAVPARSQRP
jgi:acyl-CoA thioesterase-1